MNMPERRVLVGYLPPVGGIPKTESNYALHQSLVNIGDIAYTLPGALFAGGTDFTAWNFQMPVEEVNERFTHMIFFIPCRIAEPPFDRDGYTFPWVTDFLRRLKLPFLTVCESIQSAEEDFIPDFHKRLSPEVVTYIRTLAEKSPEVGARGHFSAEVLHNLGITNVQAIGCPSLYANGPKLPSSLLVRRPFRELERIAVTYTNYQIQEGSRIRDVLRLACDRDYYYVEQSFNLVTKMLYYIDHIEAEDLLRAHHWYQGFDEIRTLYSRNRIRYFTNYRLWKAFLGSMDFVFGNRMHGQTPAIHAGVPASFIVHDSRVREMVEFHELPFQRVSHLGEGGLDPERLYESCDYGPALRRHPELYFRFLDFLNRNGFPPNCDIDGNPRFAVDPEPDPGVLQELDPAPQRPDLALSFLDLLFDLGRIAVRNGSVKGLEEPARRIARMWHQAMR